MATAKGQKPKQGRVCELQAGEVFGCPHLLPLGRGANAFLTLALSLNLSIPLSWGWMGISLLARSFRAEQAGLGGWRGPRPGGPIPGQTAPSASSSGMIRAAGPGGRLRGRGGGGGGQKPSLLQIPIEDVGFGVGLVESRAGVGEHAEVHERLVHVLRQEDEAHVEDDVFHEEGVV